MNELTLDNVGIYVDALFNLAHKSMQSEQAGTQVFQALMPLMLSQDADVQAEFHRKFNEKADGGPWDEEVEIMCEAAETMISYPIPLNSAMEGHLDQNIPAFSFFALGLFAPGLSSPLLTANQREAISSYFRKTHQVHASSEIRILPALIPLDVYCEMPWPDLFKTACLLCDPHAQIEVVPEHSPSGLYALMAVAQELVPSLTDLEEDFDSSPFSVSNALAACLDNLPQNWEDIEEQRQAVSTISKGGSELMLATMAQFDEILGTQNVMLSGIPQEFKLFDPSLYEFRLSCLVTSQLAQFMSPEDGFEAISLEDTFSIPDTQGFLCNVRHIQSRKVIGQVMLENDPRLFDSPDECGEWYQAFFASKRS